MPKQVTGSVISTAMDKTIVVELERTRKVPIYGKLVRRHKKIYAHDEKEEAKVGETVVVEESKPLSKLKRWKLVNVI